MKYVVALNCFLISFYSFSQNVGVGTNTPGGKLDVRHISTTSSPTLNLYDNNAGNFSRLQFQTASGNKAWQIAGFLDNNNDANARLNFYHNVFGDVMSLTGDGKVGIGTSAPSAKFEVSGNIKANSFQFSVPRPFYYSVSGADFSGMISSQSVIKEDRTVSIVGINGVFTNDLSVVAPIHLPNGAIILNLTAYFTDNSSEDLNIQLIEYDMAADLNTVMATVTSTGSPNKSSITTNSVTNNIINNQSKNYKLIAKTASNNSWPNGLLVVRGIMITYTLSEAQ